MDLNNIFWVREEKCDHLQVVLNPAKLWVVCFLNTTRAARYYQATKRWPLNHQSVHLHKHPPSHNDSLSSTLSSAVIVQTHCSAIKLPITHYTAITLHVSHCTLQEENKWIKKIQEEKNNSANTENTVKYKNYKEYRN